MVHVTLKRVTQKDIAHAANLSIAAVSMALKGSNALPAATIKRVRKIANRMGYVPDPALSALAAYRNTVRSRRSFAALAFVTLEPPDGPRHQLPSTRTLLEAAEARAQELGFTLQSFATRPAELSPSRLNEILTARGIEGVILAPGTEIGRGEGIVWDNFSVVATQPTCFRTGFHSVSSNPQADLSNCWQQLAARGHRRIGLVLNRQSERHSNEAWEAAHFISQRRHGVSAGDIVPNLTVHSPDTARAASRWVIENKPDAIISAQPGLAEDLRQSGFKLPQNLAYASINIEDESPATSGIARQSARIGSVAVDTITSLVQQGRAAASGVLTAISVESTWTEGTTL